MFMKFPYEFHIRRIGVNDFLYVHQL